MGIFCKHEWEIIQDVTTKSKAELHGEATGNVPQAQNSYHNICCPELPSSTVFTMRRGL